MRRLSPLLLLPLTLLLACDADEDGLSNADEKELGTDPDLADTDGDGLSDGQEVNDLGTDPLSLDSDADGYLDQEEVAVGSDPADAASVIYTGSWPYNADKDEMGAPDLGGSLQVGDTFPRFSLTDQHGQSVDVYDFFGQGVPVIVDISAMWCGPCNALADMVATGEDEYGFSNEWGHIKEHLDAGAMRWITILGENKMGNEMTLSAAEKWEDDHPRADIPILFEEGAKTTAYALLADAWPTVYLVDADGTILSRPGSTDSAFYKALDAADAWSPAE
ncbi:MAG: redoxin domain-containing protein [Deltaproteobacteria bacterium]|nr:redoxin domain-containing protein [Deltaproteobacteria bacterium]